MKSTHAAGSVVRVGDSGRVGVTTSPYDTAVVGIVFSVSMTTDARLLLEQAPSRAMAVTATAIRQRMSSIHRRTPTGSLLLRSKAL